MPELKPCPFCGTADIEPTPGDWQPQRGRWVVMCPNTSCLVRVCTAVGTKDRVTRLWNRRADASRP